MKYKHVSVVAGLALTATSANAASIAVSSYTYDAAGVPVQTGNALEDPSFSKLTDGVYPIGGWSNGEHVGWRDGSAAQKLVGKPSVTFDLGGQFDLATVDIWTEEQFSASGNGDQSVTISSSTDGSTWNPTVVATPLAWVDQSTLPGQSLVYGRKVTIDVSSLPTGEFYKMNFATTGQWQMLTEIDFDGTAAVTAVPEPSTTALLGLGGLALVFRRRK